MDVDGVSGEAWYFDSTPQDAIEFATIATAFDGMHALEVGAEFHPDVVLLDIGLPKLNGYDTARRIRQEQWGRDVVLVALTGWGKDEDRRRSSEAGFNSHLVKPVEFEQLVGLLADLQSAR